MSITKSALNDRTSHLTLLSLSFKCYSLFKGNVIVIYNNGVNQNKQHLHLSYNQTFNCTHAGQVVLTCLKHIYPTVFLLACFDVFWKPWSFCLFIFIIFISKNLDFTLSSWTFSSSIYSSIFDWNDIR